MTMAKKLLILVAVLAVVAGAYFVVVTTQSPERGDDTSSKSIKIIDTREDNMSEFTIRNNGKDFVFQQNEKSAWNIIRPSIALEYNKKVGLVYDVASIFASRVIEENAKDIAQYGLTGENTVHIKMKDGKEYNFEIGDSAPDLSGYYFRDMTNSKVYLISNSKAENLLTDFSKIMTPYVIQATKEELKSLKVKENGKVKYDIYAQNENKWCIRNPIKGDVRTRVVEELMGVFESMEIDQYTSFTSKNFKKLGLNKPRYEFEVKYTDGTVNVKIGNDDERGRYYAVRSSNDTVFVISKAKLPFLERPVQDIAEAFIGLEDITDIKTLTVEFDDTKDVSHIVSDTDSMYEDEDFSFNGYDVSTLQDDDAKNLFKNYLATISAVTWYEIDLTVKPKLKNVKYKYTFEYDNGDKTSYSFVKKNANYFYCFKNGKYSGFIVEKEKFDEMRAQRKILEDEAKRRAK